MIDWIDTHIPPWVFIAIIAHLTVLGTVAYLILLERKVASWVQDRIGPNRVGLGFGIIPFLKDFHFWGLGQPLADGLKFILKEDYRPKNADKILFTVAPGFMILVVIISIAVLPWGGWHQRTKMIDVSGEIIRAEKLDAVAQRNLAQGSVITDISLPHKAPAGAFDDDGQHMVIDVTYRYPFQIANLNIGVLFILAVLSLAVYGVVIGGWASNNKYSFLGGLRATANMISYEIPLGLAVLTIVVMFGTLDLEQIVEKQAHYWVGVIPAWNIFCQPLAFLLFLVCIHAEANRAPFDLAEAEQELVGGYHTEYSAMRFALFFLSEYAGMITTSAVLVALFLGGWHFPGLTGNVDPANPGVTTSLSVCILRAIVFFAKTLAVIFIFMWTRWSLPRFRFDQLMMIAWRALIPISLALLIATTLVVYFYGTGERAYLRVSAKMAVALLVVNVIVFAATMIASLFVPPAPATNKKLWIPGSRFNKTPLPASA
jgi:NADH-quinone oxidoreductase subunit H